MPELKTRKTTASVQAFLKKTAKGDRYEACQFLLVTFEKATKDKAAMWAKVQRYPSGGKARKKA